MGFVSTIFDSKYIVLYNDIEFSNIMVLKKPMNDTMQAVCLLNRRAIAEGSLVWEIPASPHVPFQISPEIIQPGGAPLGYAFAMTLEEARSVEVYTPLISETLRFIPEPDRLHTCFIAQVYVVPEGRKSGTYRKMYDSLVTRLRGLGYTRLIGGIKVTNDHSMKVHTKKAGFGWSVRGLVGNFPNQWILVSTNI